MTRSQPRWYRRTQIIVPCILLVLVGLVAGGLFWFEDFDFYQPPHPLQCAAVPANAQPLRFIAFGDYGEGTPFQAELGQQMARTFKQTPYPLALLLGDNIYPNGDINRLAKTHFENPYAALIQNKVRFLAAIGDHDDHHGHKQAEMAYFKMPGEYYKVSQGPVDFFILNTTHFVHSPEQRAWLEKTLSQSHARWKIVIGHHPLYSSGRNGNTEGLKAILEPMLSQHHVDLYLSGHDHDYERFKPSHGVHYMVSGGGGSFLYNFKSILPNSLVHLRTHHFMLFEVTDNHIWAKAINRQGAVIDCTDWQKGKI